MYKTSFAKTWRHYLAILFYSLNNFKKIYSLWNWSIVVKTPFFDKVWKKWRNKELKPVSINSNVAKETNPVETTTSVELTSKSSRSTETKIVHEKPNQFDSTFVFPKTAFA